MITFDNIKLYDVQETAEVLRVTPQTVRKFIQRGELKAKKIGRPYYIDDRTIKEYIGRKEG